MDIVTYKSTACGSREYKNMITDHLNSLVLTSCIASIKYGGGTYFDGYIENGHMGIRYPGSTRGTVQFDKDGVITNIWLYDDDIAKKNQCYKPEAYESIKKFIGDKLIFKGEEIMGTLIVSGFPGVGKSHLFNNDGEKEILDSDSSQFSWKEKGVRHPDFPNNYIEHIKSNIGRVDVILVSSHAVVRQALKEKEIPYVLVYPDKTCKEEYLERYKQRGNDQGFIDMMNVNWDKFLDELETEEYPTKVILESGEFLSKLIKK